jgi:hypothetical protein
MKQGRENLLIADFQHNDDYANAVLFRHLIATAGHVAEANPIIMTQDKKPGSFSFREIPGRDLALSKNDVPHNLGFDEIYTPSVGEIIVICGYHGKLREYFEISAKVIKVNNRILVEAIPIKNNTSKKPSQPEDFEKIFQLGMSGSVALNSQNNQMIGILVSSAFGDFPGHRVYLEPASYLQ